MRIKFVVLLLIVIIGGSGWGVGKKKNPAPLPQKYRQWLKVVHYIITGEERSTFRKLASDRERDVFINLFWNLRDPSPGTQQNEFREEHLKRFNYANKYFKHGSPREGWRTDMGMIFIILGEPASKERFDIDDTVVPAQIWSYYGKNPAGLPSSFRIVFWQKDSMGEYKLYDPASDGPYALLRQTRETRKLDPTDTEACYLALQAEHPTLANASLSLISGEEALDASVSMRSQQLLTKVVQLPQSKINDSYATNFLKYKGKVSVDYSINYIEAHHNVRVIKDGGTGIYFVHFALRPRLLSALAYSEAKDYSFNFQLSVALNKGTQTVFEYRKDFPYTGSREEMLRNFSNSVIISDLFPVTAGDYRLSVLLQNKINKEFTYFDKAISVPGTIPGKPVISGLVLAKEAKKLPRQMYLPFKYGDLELTPAPRRQFGTGDRIYAVFNIERGNYPQPFSGVLEVQDIFDHQKYQKSYPLEFTPGSGVQTIRVLLETPPSGYYRAQPRLITPGGEPLAETSESFTISVRQHTENSTHLFKAAAFRNRFVYYHILALQEMNLGRLDTSGTFFEQALRLRPGYGVLIKDYCGLLLKRKRPSRILEIAENLKGQEQFRFDYYALRGKAFFLLEKYNMAVEELVKANRMYDSDVSVLNYLGFTYLKKGNREEAHKLFTASLELDDRQKAIADVLNELSTDIHR